MKKTIITALVVLLVILAFATCDGFITEPGGENSGAEKAEYTADGRELVTVNVNVGGTAGSRALTSALAKEEANYMEVIFKDDYNGKTQYYRAGGPVKNTLKIRLPGGKYDKDNSILLIGKKIPDTSGATPPNDDYALLAIGTCSETTLHKNSPTIEFDKITVLTTELYAGATPTSFSILNTDFSSLTPPLDDFDGETADGTWSDKEAQCFQVPTGTHINAELKIKGFGDAEFNKNIALVNSSTVKTLVAFTQPLDDDVYNIEFVLPTGGDGTLSFSFFSGYDEGYYIITFDIPVVGFEVYDDIANPSTTPGLEKAYTWHIRGGTSSTPNEVQLSEEDEQEGIALYIGNRPFSMVDGKVKPPVLPPTP